MIFNLAEHTIDPKQVERLTQRIGTERVEQRDAQTKTFIELPLVEKFEPANGKQACPDLAVVMVDGGRLQIRSEGRLEETTAAGEASPTQDWDEPPPKKKSHWREDKIALLLTMSSTKSAVDPCPQIPQSFLDIVRIPILVKQLKSTARMRQGGEAAESEEISSAEEPSQTLATVSEYEPPDAESRRVLASRRRWPEFAPQVAAAAHGLNFQGANRKAFVADGSSNNWTLHKRFFSSFEAILDFIHALSYVYAAATADRSLLAGWSCYERWIGWVWEGKVSAVIVELKARQQEMREGSTEETRSSAEELVSKTLGYLEHHQEKMRYDVYRRNGLPLTSSLMESTVKQINIRVKGTEKFWTEWGSEAVLQLCADTLSEKSILDDFWDQRQADANGLRPYRTKK